MPNGSRYSLLGRFPLRWQLSLPVLISIVLLGVTYTHYWASRYAEQRRTTFVESGQRAVQILTPQLSELMRAGDVSGIEATLRRFANWDYLAHAKVYGDQGRVAAYNLQDNVSEAFREHLTQYRVHHNHVFEIDGLTVFMGDLTGRNGDTIGHLAVAFDQAQVEAGIYEARQEALSIGLVGCLVISGLVFVLSMSITRPLSRATMMIDRVARGDLNFITSDTERRDEVGRIARAVEVFRRNAADLIKAQAEATASRKVAQMALVDPLTNIPNRRALEEHLSGIRADASLEMSHLYVLHIDLDGFKQINDTLGHAAGDRVLQAISERLVACLPPGGFAARVGGDEFVVTLAASEGSSLPEDVTMRIIDAARQDIEFEDQKMRVSCSVGVAAACIQLGQFAEALVHADIALYRAKADGKNRYALFSQKHRQDVLDRKNLAEDLFRGLEAGEFEPYFQPQVRAGDHRIIGCEVLARWHHPTRGVLLPADFIQVAEDIGVLRHIDRMIFQKASVHYAAWREAGVALPSLSFNISVQRLFEKDLRDGIEEMCKAGIKVNIELVESTYLDELADNVMWILVELRALGAGIEIDDFGTGHSSVAGLLRVNPDRIKIDRQFVIPMETSERERQLVGLFIQIARTLNMEIVAEGVETLDHARSLAELGCDTLQGFAFGGAMPAEAFLAELTRPEGLRATG